MAAYFFEDCRRRTGGRRLGRGTGAAIGAITGNTGKGAAIGGVAGGIESSLRLAYVCSLFNVPDLWRAGHIDS
jgi:hypothetical protein